MPAEAIPKGSTTQSAMTWVVDHQLHRAPDALVRRDIASNVGALAQATKIDPARLATLGRPLLSLLDDPEPAVRAEACAGFELLAARCLYKDAFEEALVVVDALAAHDVNLDMQSARRWQCLAALDCDEIQRFLFSPPVSIAEIEELLLATSSEASPLDEGDEHLIDTCASY